MNGSSDTNETALQHGIPPKPEGSKWTDGQWRAIVRRDRNLLVAAAAGSGKTAVLVQRIIRRISDESDPIDVDRLLVATFTKAAASEMRHRIGEALEEALFKRPDSDHLRKQLALLNRASITTLHSFCMEVIQRYFQMIDLDPGFRIADETEAALLRQEQLEALLEEKYAESPEEHPFWSLVEWFGGDRSDAPLLALIERLFDSSMSHPFPEKWLEEMAGMYGLPDEEVPSGQADGAGTGAGSGFDSHPWLVSLMRDVRLELAGAGALLEEGLRVCGQPGGPTPYAGTLEDELALIRYLQEAGNRDWSTLYQAFQTAGFGRLKPCKGDAYDKELQEQVKSLRKGAKDKLDKLQEELFVRTPAQYMEELRRMAPLMKELVALTEAFAARYHGAKTDRGLVDFTDLEHFCLRILGAPAEDGSGLKPTAAALAYREQYIEIMLDEYQDTNLVQETIVSLIARQEPGNRFLVGDVKQSIYRFRLAEPGLFLEKYRSYGSGADAGTGADGSAGAATVVTATAAGERIDLARNFRSRRQVVDSVNYLFRQIMREDVGEMEYDPSAELVCGASYPEPEREAELAPDYSAELVLLDKGDTRRSEAARGDGESSGEEASAAGQEGEGEGSGTGLPDEAEELETAQLEARYIGSRIRQMMGLDGSVPFPVTERTGSQRPAQFRDFVILLRATRSWAPVLMEELAQMGIPAYADVSSGYFAATEVETVLSLLKIIDNPHQDIPLAAVLRSPIVGLSADELAQVRLADRQGDYYRAVQAWVRQAGERMRLPEEEAIMPAILQGFGNGGERSTGANPAAIAAGPSGILLPIPGQENSWAEAAAASEPGAEALAASFMALAHKLLTFERRLAGWRKETRQGSLSDLIWSIYRETGYFDYVGGLPGGAQRQANLRALYDRARQYESTSFRGLFRFLRFVERMREGGDDLGTARALGEQEDVVRIMSIHKSKGLEFPVVFVAGMGKMFNLMDLNGAFLIHKELGFGPKYMSTELRAVYPTLPQLSIRRRMRMETLAEEMRVLYVALTRAKEKLILQGSVSNMAGKLVKWCRALSSDKPYLADHELAEARSYLDWVVPAALRHPGARELRKLAGEMPYVCGELYVDEASEWSFSVVQASELASSSTQADEPELAELYPDVRDKISRLDPVPAAPTPLAEEIGRRLSWSYLYAEASGMLTKTSVSELKRLSAKRVLTITGEGFEWEAPMYPGITGQELSTPQEALEASVSKDGVSGVLYRLPKFRTDRKLTPAEVGTLYHTVMQHLPQGYAPNEAQIAELLDKLQERRILTAEDRKALQPSVISSYYDTEIGRRMAAALRVHRELPFSFGLRAGEVYPDCDPAVADETLLIQGVIDCLFEDAEGRLVLLDYKTDRIRGLSEEVLAARYKLQLELYGRAIEMTWKRKVDQKAVYYFDGSRVVYYT